MKTVLTTRGTIMADVIAELNIPVILVVGMRLGCLNHALLTMQAIHNSGCHCAGWIANCLDPQMDYLQENIDTLRQSLPAPCWSVFAYSLTA